MSSVVLDSSAVIAFVCREPGGENVAKYLPGALISSVNLAEVFSKSADKGVTLEALKWMVHGLQLKVVPFDEEAAFLVGSLREPTRAAGLSLGDRACLSLGILQIKPVITKEKSWLNTNLGVEIQLIR